MLIYNKEENKWQCSNCGATYYPEELKRVWDYSINPVVEELKLYMLCFILLYGLWNYVI